jgi:hypothetical protein
MTDDAEREAVRDALRQAGVDPTDLGRFVNRPNPNLRGLEPETFDTAAARPVLLEWLPRLTNPRVRSTIAARLRQAVAVLALALNARHGGVNGIGATSTSACCTRRPRSGSWRRRPNRASRQWFRA